MLPRNPLPDVPHGAGVNAEVARNMRQSLAGICSGANCPGLIIGQLGSEVLGAAWFALRVFAGAAIFSARGIGASLRETIPVVLSVSPEPQMSRIATKSVVAGVQHKHGAFGQLGVSRQLDAVMQLICQAVGKLVLSLPSDDPVTVQRATLWPRPAFVWLAGSYLRPEALYGIGGSAHA